LHHETEESQIRLPDYFETLFGAPVLILIKALGNNGELVLRPLQLETARTIVQVLMLITMGWRTLLKQNVLNGSSYLGFF
jgi:hypothetical protein